MKRKELQILRVKHQLTQQQMADKLGISRACYSYIENGKRVGTQKTWVKLQKIFNLKDGEVWKIQNNI